MEVRGFGDGPDLLPRVFHCAGVYIHMHISRTWQIVFIVDRGQKIFTYQDQWNHIWKASLYLDCI